jgi:hypothetical protein
MHFRSVFPSALFVAAALTLPAQVRFSADTGDIAINGKPFTTYHPGTDIGKPFLAPVRSASGKIVTRHWPMENVEGESRDHPHHRGLWFSYDDVNGVKFWENDPSYTKPNMGRIIATKAEWKGGERAGTLTTAMEWRDPKGKALLIEDRTMTFPVDPTLRSIDFDIKLTATGQVVFGDTKEGAFAIRLADSMAEKKTGKMINAEGQSGMKNVWGKRSNWVDYSGDVEGERLGVAMFDHPSNPRHPTYWHSRDYGLFALDPFGQKAFDPKAEESHWTLASGQSVRFRWRVVIHPGDTQSAHIDDLYKKYAATR